MPLTEKRAEWKTHYDAWKGSEQSIAGWCRDQGVNVHQMYYWVKRFENDEMVSAPAPTEWLAIQVDEGPGHSEGPVPVFIHLDAISVEVRPGADVGLLADILEILKRPC